MSGSKSSILPIILPTLLVVIALIPSNALRAWENDCSTTLLHAHPWARFCLGSWKRVRVKTETFDEQGNCEGITVTETQTTLERAVGCNYTLRIDVTVEVDGKRFTAQPHFVSRGVFGETAGQQVKVESLGPQQLTINGHVVSSEVQKVTIQGKHSKRVSTVYCSSGDSPLVVKRTTLATDLVGKHTQYQTHTETVALNTPRTVLNEQKTVHEVKTVNVRSGGKTITTESHCLDVPGAVVGHVSRQFDSTGRLIRQSTLALVDYQAVEPSPKRPKRRRLFFRRRNRRR